MAVTITYFKLYLRFPSKKSVFKIVYHIRNVLKMGKNLRSKKKKKKVAIVRFCSN